MSSPSPVNPSGIVRKSKTAFIIGAAAKGLIKSLAISLVVMAPGFLLLVSGQAIPGMIALFMGSFGLMAWSYRKPWRLGWISCWTPPLAAVLSYLIQFLLFSHRMPRAEIVIVALAAGALVGLLRAATHRVYFEGSQIKARRTFGYLIIWIVSYGATQIFASIGRNTLAHAGLITGAFATAMLSVVSVVIFFKFVKAQGDVVHAEVR